MGATVAKLCNPLKTDKKYILIVGQEKSGKTTFLYGPRLKPGWEQSTFEPTVGYNYEESRTTAGVLGIFDTPGNEALFPIVRNLYQNLEIAGIIYVFRLSENAIDFILARRKIKFFANEPELKACAFVVVANVASEIDNQFREKDYLKDALGVNELKHIKDKEIFVFDAKYSPKEGELVWRWMSDKVEVITNLFQI